MAKLLFIFIIALSTSSISHSVEAAYDLAEAKHWKIVNYWAEWCTPCRQEIPELNHLSLLLKESNITVVGVNYDDLDADELTAVVQRMGIKFVQLTEQQKALLTFPAPAALPATYIISPSGELKLRLLGKQTAENILIGLAQVKPDFSISSSSIQKPRTADDM